MESRKKILHTSTRLVLGGGVEKNIYHTIENLKHEFVFHLSCGVDYKEELFRDHPDIKTIICPQLVHKISPLKDLRALWFYYKLIRKEKYDIVHTHETKASFITRVAAWLARCPYIIYGLHGVTFNDPMHRLKRKFFVTLEKITVSCADFIVSVGYDTIDEYHAEKIALKIPYTVVRSGIDIDEYLSHAVTSETEKQNFRRSLGIKDDDIVMVNVGRFSSSKAQRYTIEACAALKKKHANIRLLLLGEGELLEECKTLAQSLGLDNETVVFLGYQEDVPRFLSVCDLFIFTSLREGLPRVIVEASLLQLPVVTFAVEGAAEVLEHEKSGFIVPQGDVPALIYYADQLISRPELRKQFGQKAQQHVMKNWDMRIMASQLREIYNTKLP